MANYGVIPAEVITGVTIQQRVDRGVGKLTAKAASMKTNYEASIPTAIAHYKAIGFNARVTADYEAGLRRGVASYNVNPTKWAERYLAKMT